MNKVLILWKAKILSSRSTSVPFQGNSTPVNQCLQHVWTHTNIKNGVRWCSDIHQQDHTKASTSHIPQLLLFMWIVCLFSHLYCLFCCIYYWNFKQRCTLKYTCPHPFTKDFALQRLRADHVLWKSFSSKRLCSHLALFLSLLPLAGALYIPLWCYKGISAGTRGSLDMTLRSSMSAQICF